MANSKTKLSAMAIIVVSIGVASFIFLQNYLSQSNAISYTEVTYVSDFSSKQRLVGFGDNVFVGTVLAQVGTHFPGDIPETLFSVQVIENIKGDFSGEVIVNQQGGYWPRDERSESVSSSLHLVEADPLLIPGQTYLFVTRVGNNGEWNTLVPNFGDVLVQSSEHQKQLVEEFTIAKQEEIPFNPAE